MAGLTWVDTTSRSRGDRDSEPNSWSAQAGGLLVRIHRHIHHAPDVWLLSTRPDIFYGRPLVSRDIEGAKAEAARLVGEWCRGILAALGDFRPTKED